MISLVVFSLFLVLLIVTFCLFDKLVKIEFERHHEHWILDGKPIGFFWQPKQTGHSFLFLWVGGSVARSRRSMEWLFLTPDWAITDTEVRTKLRYFRVSGFTSICMGLLWFGVVWLL